MHASESEAEVSLSNPRNVHTTLEDPSRTMYALCATAAQRSVSLDLLDAENDGEKK